MKITPDDPRLTACALDELDGAEREAIETELQNSDECRREVEEISRAAALLSAELAAEPLPELPHAQQLAIEAKLKPDSGNTESRRHFPIGVLLKGRSPIGRALGFAAGAAVLVGIWLGLSSLFTAGPGPGTTALAQTQTLEQMQKAQFITWTQTFYNHLTGEDGQKWVWTVTNRYAYRAPGLYRKEEIHTQPPGWPEDREIGAGKFMITIADTVNRRELTLIPAEKRAILAADVTITIGEREGPYASSMKYLKGDDLRLVGTRKTPTGEVNVFRLPSGPRHSLEYWIDSKTKNLVEFRVPGTDFYDPDTDPARNNPPGKARMMGPTACINSDFVFGADLDDSLFRLVPPPDYTVETRGRLHVTEKEMIDFLGILADYNDKTFPERSAFAGVFSDGRTVKSMEKPKEDRTSVEQKFAETLQHYVKMSLPDPIGDFRVHSTVENSFRYLGKGVRLGDAESIVCWYKLNGAKTYRVVYGDLSIKDVPPEDLPLRVEP